jgi:hypothetical protein
MKTPREILLERHRAVAPKLDTIRRSAVAVCDRQFRTNEVHAEQSQTAAITIWRIIWSELIFPSRRIWTGLAAVWILIFAVNFSQRDNVSSVTGQSVRSEEVIMSVQAQQRWMNELLADRLVAPEADRPRNFTPKPRTEKSETASV